MASINKSALAAYRQALDKVCSGAGSATMTALEEWLGANPGASVAQIREAAIELTGDVLGIYGDAASSLACELFDSMMEAEGVSVPAAQIYDGIREGAIEGTVRRVVGDVDGTQESLDAFAQSIGQFAEDETRRAASSTVEQNVERASKTKAGRNVRYARVPTKAVPCEWCAMLASRGFVYSSAQRAEAASHHRCACTIVPGVQGRTKVDGYDPNHYLDVWQNREKYVEGELPDIVIPFSVGADVYRDLVRIPRKLTGLDHDIHAALARNSRITGVRAIAGPGTSKPIRGELDSLKDEYPEVPRSAWIKYAGNGIVEDLGLERLAHLHWYWADGVGRVRMKVDHFL